MLRGKALGAVGAGLCAAALVVPVVRSTAAPAGPQAAPPDRAPSDRAPSDQAQCDLSLLRPECAGISRYEYAIVDGHRIPVVRPRVIVDVRRNGAPWGTERIAVPGPCAYYRVWTGAWMYDWPAPQDIRDRFPDDHDTFINYRARTIGRIVMPNGIGSIEPDTDQSSGDKFGHIGSDLNITFGEVAAHRGDNTGYWWQYECSIDQFAGLKAFPPERIRRKFLEWHAQAPMWRFWQPGQEAPPDIPADPDLAELILAGVINPLVVDFAPRPDQSVVNLLTWTWEDASARGPVEIRVTGGGRTVGGIARPGPLLLHGETPGTDHAAADLSGLRCATGGMPYVPRAPDTATDCGLRFDAPTPQGAAGPVLRFAQRWRLSVDGVPIAGPAGIVDRLSPAYAFNVREAQTAN